MAVEYEDAQLALAMSDAYHVGHENLYENFRSPQELERMLGRVEQAMPMLEALQKEPPRPYTIKDQNRDDLYRLRMLTGNNDLANGDSSAVGFSLRHGPDGSNGSNGGGNEDGPKPATPASPSSPPSAGGGVTGVALKPGKKLAGEGKDEEPAPARRSGGKRDRGGQGRSRGKPAKVNIKVE